MAGWSADAAAPVSIAEAGRAVHRRRRTDLGRSAGEFRHQFSERRVGLEDPVSECADRLRLAGERHGAAILKTDRWRADLEADRGQRSADGMSSSKASALSTRRSAGSAAGGTALPSGSPDGTTSGTTDGGATWFNANDVGRFPQSIPLHRDREPIAGYASGRTIYQCVAADDDGGAVRWPRAVAARMRPSRRVEMLDIKAEVPDDAQQLTVTIFNPRQTLVKVLADETSPAPGARTFTWDFKTDDGKDTGTGHFIYRVSIDGNADHRDGGAAGARHAGGARRAGRQDDRASRADRASVRMTNSRCPMPAASRSR